jgi:hypothetical protein
MAVRQVRAIAITATFLLSSCSQITAASSENFQCEFPKEYNLNQQFVDMAFNAAINPETGMTAKLVEPTWTYDKPYKNAVSGRFVADLEAYYEKERESIAWSLATPRPYVYYGLYSEEQRAGLRPLVSTEENIYNFLQFEDGLRLARHEIVKGAVTQLPFLEERYSSPLEQLLDTFSLDGDRMETFVYGDVCAIGHIYKGNDVVKVGQVREIDLNGKYDKKVDSAKLYYERNSALADCWQRMSFSIRGLLFVPEEHFGIDRREARDAIGAINSRRASGDLSIDWYRPAYIVHKTLMINGTMNRQQLCAAMKSNFQDWNRYEWAQRKAIDERRKASKE